MLFLQLHIGDWMTETRDLSPTEQGVYFDLLVRYVAQEAPLMQVQCSRIARAYSVHERAAMDFILETFFEFDGEAYRSPKAEQIIADKRSKSETKRNAAMARWSKKSSTSDGLFNETKESEKTKSQEILTDATAMQLLSTSNADAMLTDNRKPITDKEKEKTNKKKNTPFMKPLDCSQEVFDEWVVYKKQSGGKCTQRMIDAITREAALGEMTTEAAMVMQMEQGWQGFKAQWAVNLTHGAKVKQSVIGPKCVEPDWSQENYGEIGLL